MGVLKSLRRRNRDKGRRMSKNKHLNYSAMSNDSGDTHEISKDDAADDAFFALLIERENLTVTTSTAPDDQGAGPQVVSPLSSPKLPTMQETGAQPNRRSLEPIAPLGVVVNGDNEKEDEWDAISHISGISTRSESSTVQKKLSSEEIKQDLETMAASFERSSSKPIVSPEQKKETLEHGSLVQNIVQNLESGNNARAVDILVNVDTPSSGKAKHMDRINRILRSVNEKKEGSSVVNSCSESSETGSKVSHVFEDDSNNVISDSSEESPMYSPSITLSAHLATYTPSLEAVFTMKTERPTPPGINGAVARSFDGSTATVFTDNTSAYNSIKKVENSVETSQDESAKSPAPPAFAPSCDSIFSSPTAISANLKDSLDHIKKELNDVYESSASGLASAAAKVEGAIKCSRPFFWRKKSKSNYVQPKFDEETLGTENTIQAEETSRTGGKPMSENDKEFFKRTETQVSF